MDGRRERTRGKFIGSEGNTERGRRDSRVSGMQQVGLGAMVVVVC